MSPKIRREYPNDVAVMSFRVPVALKEVLVAEAERDGRTLGQHVQFLLKRHPYHLPIEIVASVFTDLDEWAARKNPSPTELRDLIFALGEMQFRALRMLTQLALKNPE